MIGSIFVDQEGNEVEVLKWKGEYVYFTYCGKRLFRFVSKKKFLKEFEPKEEQNEQL